MPRWRKNSIFGDGPRVRLDRNGRARFRFLARAHRDAGRLTADDVAVAEVLVSKSPMRKWDSCMARDPCS
jgi:hypothetical protein